MESNRVRMRNEAFEYNFQHGMCTLFTHQEFCDVTFAAGNNLYNAHKVVLSVSSVYLRNLLLSSPAKYPIIVLSDVRPEILEDLLQFIYCGTVDVHESDIDDFLSSGRNLQIKGLQNIVLQHNKSAQDNTVITNEDFSGEQMEASTIKFSPNLLRTYRAKKKSSRKAERGILKSSTPKKVKKRHSVSFKLDNDEIEDSDDQMFRNIMEPEVSIQDDFIKKETEHSDNESTGIIDKCENTEQTNHMQATDIQFVTGTSGKPHLICNEYTFHKNTMRRDRVYWLCAAYQSPLQCRARCVTIEGKIISTTGHHNHKPDYKEKIAGIMEKMGTIPSIENMQEPDIGKSILMQM